MLINYSHNLLRERGSYYCTYFKKKVQEQEEMFQMENKPVKFVKRKDFVTIPISRKKRRRKYVHFWLIFVDVSQFWLILLDFS